MIVFLFARVDVQVGYYDGDVVYHSLLFLPSLDALGHHEVHGTISVKGIHILSVSYYLSYLLVGESVKKTIGTDHQNFVLRRQVTKNLKLRLGYYAN